ncbi:WXG100 family type VII secretion target [Microbacterium xylanilyticum]
MAMYGADVTQLRTLAQQFERQAQQLDAHRMTVGNAIQISAWAGPVAVRFRHQWESQYSRQVHSAAERLRGAAGDLRRNADEQDRASAADAGGFSGGGGGGRGWGDTSRETDPWYVDLSKTLLPALERSYDLLSKADGGMELIDKVGEWARGDKVTALSLAKVSKLGILTSGYEIAHGWPETWDDIQSGNIWRFTKAIFRTGYTAAKAIPVVGLVDTAANVGIDVGKGIMDTFLGPGASDRAFNDVGRQIDGVGNAINDAGAKAGKAVADSISSGVRWLKGLFS